MSLKEFLDWYGLQDLSPGWKWNDKISTRSFLNNVTKRLHEQDRTNYVFILSDKQIVLKVRQIIKESKKYNNFVLGLCITKNMKMK